MAEVKTFGEQCEIGGGIVHLGATSMDVQDNADAIRLSEGLEIIIEKLKGLLRRMGEQIIETVDHTTMAFTHLQPAGADDGWLSLGSICAGLALGPVGT